MKHKALWRVSILTLPAAEDVVSEILSEHFNHPAVTYIDLETGISTVSCYLSKKIVWLTSRKVLQTALDRLKVSGLAIGSGKIQLRKIRRENWAESWKRHFQPIEISPSLLVKPSWSKRRAKKNQAMVVLDPGLSFGTGQHPTTRFCLQQLARHFSKFRIRTPKKSARHTAAQKIKPSFLDIGTGSGILAIAAAKLGGSPVEAFDFDPEAVTIARTNARRNRVSKKIRIHRADVTRLPHRNAKQFSMVCANLISNLLISEQLRILATVKPDGILVLAGILKTEFKLVQNAYENAGLQFIRSLTENEWTSGVFAKKITD